MPNILSVLVGVIGWSALALSLCLTHTGTFTGHEVIGKVVAVGSETNDYIKVGKRVGAGVSRSRNASYVL